MMNLHPPIVETIQMVDARAAAALAARTSVLERRIKDQDKTIAELREYNEILSRERWRLLRRDIQRRKIHA